MKYDEDIYYTINPEGDELAIWIDKDAEDEYKYFIAIQSGLNEELQYIKVNSTPDGYSVALSLNELTNLRDLIDEVLANN